MSGRIRSRPLKGPQEMGVVERPLGGRGRGLLVVLNRFLRPEGAQEVRRAPRGGRPQAPEEVRGSPGAPEAPEKVRGGGGAPEAPQEVRGARRRRPETPEEVRGAALGRPQRPQEVAVVHPVVSQVGGRRESAPLGEGGGDALCVVIAVGVIVALSVVVTAEIVVAVTRVIEVLQRPQRPKEVGGASTRAKGSQEMA